MNVLITGEHGYIGNSISKWLLNNGLSEQEISFLNVRDDSWKSVSFNGIQAIVHCAGLVHKRQDEYTLDDYRRVNTILTSELAKKAKKEGVKQFVFMSTKGVYGMHKSCYDEVVVTEDTPLAPYKKYGVSKKEAEDRLIELEDANFKVSIIRSPFIYGKGCSGNYQQLRRLVLKYRFVPKMPSRISMLYIDNLCELVRQILVQRRHGIFMPQNLPIHSSSEMAVLIAKYNKKRIICTSLFNPLVRLASKRITKINSAFGSSIYDEKLSSIEGIDYQVVGFEQSLEITERE